ncbi:MAG: ELM1/GtrOC1 family putative glycosyltransferase [Halothermotrichaceae bacterium]
MIKEKNILIISDRRPGHFNQSMGIAEQVKNAIIDVVVINFSSKFSDFCGRLFGFFHRFISFNRNLSDKALKILLNKDNYRDIVSKKPDIIISAGSSVAVVNILLGQLNDAYSVVCMTPSIIGTSPFDLAIVPEHDNPPKKSNIFKTIGAPNRINSDFVNKQTVLWNKIVDFNLQELNRPVVSLLIGGSNSFFDMKLDMITMLVEQSKKFVVKNNGTLLVTTSIRTPEDIKQMLKNKLSDKSQCPLLIIAEEWDENPVPMMVNVSDIVIVTEDSVSMISEAVSGNERVLVAALENHKNKKLPRYFKVTRLLNKEGYIKYLEYNYLKNGKLEVLLKDLYKARDQKLILHEAARAAEEIEKRFFSKG